VASLLQVAFGVGVSFVIAVVSFELFESRFLAFKSAFECRAKRAPAAATEWGYRLDV
jgi:peptidoglycan/LPS O-acetylase OafA/YrhL